MQKRAFTPGFRLSTLDVMVIAVGSIGVVGLAFVVPWLAFVVAFVTGHFFVFCNVVRMARPLELIWAGVFVVLAGMTVAIDWPGWLATSVVSLAVTAVVVVIEMRKPSYHGVGWQWINPGLPAWWDAHASPCECGQKH